MLSQLRHIQSVFAQDVLLYQMGKVGSNSLSYSIEQLGLSTGHKHYFGGDLDHFYQNRKPHWTIGWQKKCIRYWWQWQNREFKVLTLVRDPMARNLSLAFHGLEYLLYHTLHGNPNNIKGQFLSFEQVVQKAFDRLIRHEAPVLYFEEEFEPVLGIDVYQYPFDRERGIGWIRKGKLQILILQLEQLAKNETQIAQFIGKSDFRLLRANTAKKSWYAEWYRPFIDQFRAENAQLRALYDSKFMQHFYTPAAIQAFEEHWRNPPTVSSQTSFLEQ
ncbi:MAG: putative capsular polysaccharide synthesis family protein [Bacteroidota bacterium]